MDPTNANKLIAAMWEYRRWPWFFKSGGPASGLYKYVGWRRNLETVGRRPSLAELVLGCTDSDSIDLSATSRIDF